MSGMQKAATPIATTIAAIAVFLIGIASASEIRLLEFAGRALVCIERIIARLPVIPTAHRVPPPRGLFAAALTGLLELLEKPRGAGALECAHYVALPFFFAELDAISLSLEFGGFLLFAAEPAGIVLSGVHVNAEFRECMHVLRVGVIEKAGKAGDRPEILRVERRDMESAQTAVGDAGDMKFVFLNLVIGEQLDDKSRKNAIALFEEEVAIGRCRNDHDIAEIFGLLAPIAHHRAHHHLHGLRSARKSQNRGIGLGRFVAGRKYHFVLERSSGNFCDFIEYFSGQG